MNNSSLFQTVYVVNCSRQGRHIITLQLGTQQKLIAAGYFQPELGFLLVPARTFKFGSGTFRLQYSLLEDMSYHSQTVCLGRQGLRLYVPNHLSSMTVSKRQGK